MGGLTDAPYFFLDNGNIAHTKRSSGSGKGVNSETTEATALSATMSDTENTTGAKASDEASMMNGETKNTEAPAVTPIGSEDVPMTEKKSDDEGTAVKDTSTASAANVSGGAGIAASATQPPAESTTTASAPRELDDEVGPSKDPEEDFADEDDVDKDEEALFCILEKEKEKEDLEEALHPEDKPKAAPALIQAGIKAGEVKDEDDDAVKSGDAEAKEEEKAGIVQVSILYECWSLPGTILFCL